MRLPLSWSRSVSLLLCMTIVAVGVTAAEKDGQPASAANSSELMELKRMLMEQQRQIEDLRRELQAQKASAAPVQPEGEVPAAGGVLTRQKSMGEVATTTAMVPPNPLTISGVSTSATPETVTVTWTTNEPATSRLDWGAAPGSLTRNVSDPNLVTMHSLTMTGLAPGTTYYVEITSTNAAGQVVKQTLGEQAKASSPTVSASSCPPLCAPVKSDQIEWGPHIRIGNSYLTPVGFVDATAIFRDTDPGSNGGTNFGSIPYRTQQNVPGNLSEFRFSPQNSRIGARFDSVYKGMKILGYWESDFLGFVPTNVEVTTHSYSLRLRLIFADLKKNGWEILGGQSWSLLTPTRKGISPLPGDLFYGQVVDWNYLAGLPWARQAGFRVAYHAKNTFHFAFAAEDPEQYIGGSGGGGTVVLPAAYTTPYAGQLNNGTNNQSVPNRAPDLIAKVAVDAGNYVHFEVGGLATFLKVYRPDTKQEFTKTGGGVQANVILGPKNFKFISTNYWSDGGGRYLFGNAPMTAVKADGSLGLMKSGGLTDGIEVTLGKTLLYAYYGAIFVGKYRVYDTNPAKPVWVGYGYEGSANSQNRQIQEGTFGFNQTLIKDAKYGAVNLMGQWAYFTRSPWVIATGAAKDTHMNEVWLNLRYTFPGAPPSLK